MTKKTKTEDEMMVGKAKQYTVKQIEKAIARSKEEQQYEIGFVSDVPGGSKYKLDKLRKKGWAKVSKVNDQSGDFYSAHLTTAGLKKLRELKNGGKKVEGDLKA